MVNICYVIKWKGDEIVNVYLVLRTCNILFNIYDNYKVKQNQILAQKQ
jgi:hypothetical protein